MSDTKRSGEKIYISNIDKIGFVHLQGVGKYAQKYHFKKCFLITPVKPHENVLKNAEQILLLKIIISSNFKQEKEKIERAYPDTEIVTVDAYQLAGREGMLDGA